MSLTVAVFVPPIHSTRPPPRDVPIARALIKRSNEFNVVFGFQLRNLENTVRIIGSTISGQDWVQTTSTFDIIHDRFPSQIRHQHFQQLHSLTTDVPWGNPITTTLLCRDKLACQRILERSGCHIPEVLDNYETFESALEHWGFGFLKPRYGALGIGVTHVQPGDPLPVRLTSVVPNQTDPSILQRGVPPPKGWKGMSVRQLVQKTTSGSWVPRTAVLRHSKTDVVVNVARGAQASPAKEILPPDTIDSIQTQSLLACSVLDTQPNGATNIEFGLDFVIDPHFKPWLIEVNSRPRGRLEFLAEQFPEQYGNEHEQACIQPILTLAEVAKNNKSVG